MIVHRLLRRLGSAGDQRLAPSRRRRLRRGSGRRAEGPLRLMVESLEERALLAANLFIVNSTADPGDGVPNTAELTLREAITAANATANLSEPDQIQFNIPASDPGHVYYRNDGIAGSVSVGLVTVTTAANDSLLTDADPDWPHSWFSIRVGSSLPAITESVVIDGYSQPGAMANTLAVGSNAVLRVEISGASAGSNAIGLQAGGDGNAIRGLAINRFQGTAAATTGYGVYLNLSDGNVVEGNRVGTDVSGTTDLGNATDGIFVRGSANNRIGGTSPAARSTCSR